jgi:hypothetical protein
VSWSDAPSASAPDQSGTTGTEQPASATTAPDPSATEGITPVQGEPPKERWADILENARSKAREEADAQWAPHAWAKQIPQTEFQQLQSIAKHFQGGDPITGLQNLIAEIRKDPQHDAALRSLAAREMGRRTQQPQAPQMVNVQLEDGTVVEMPRNPSEWLAAQKAQWLQEAEQKFTPFTQTVEQLQAERAASAKAQQVTHYVETTYADVKTWPGMDDAAMQKAVSQELARNVVSEDDPREISLALNAAYRKVVLPQLSQRAQSQQLDDLKRKAASTSMNPGNTANATGRTYNSFSELPPEAWR